MFFILQLLLGYVFCCIIVNGPGIGTLLERWTGKLSFIGVAATVLYFLGSIFVLNGPCLAGSETYTVGGLTFTSAFPSRAAWSLLYRALAFALPQAVALHWTLMDSIPGMGDVALTPTGCAKMRCKQWSAVAIGASIGAGAACYDMYLLASIGRLQWYLLGLLLTVLLFVVVTWLVRHTRYLHFHHYCFALLAPWFPVRESAFSTFGQAVFLFIACEGVCRWGPDPVWPLRSPEELAALAAARQAAQDKKSAAASGASALSKAGAQSSFAGAGAATSSGAVIAAAGATAVAAGPAILLSIDKGTAAAGVGAGLPAPPSSRDARVAAARGHYDPAAASGSGSCSGAPISSLSSGEILAVAIGSGGAATLATEPAAADSGASTPSATASASSVGLAAGVTIDIAAGASSADAAVAPYRAPSPASTGNGTHTPLLEPAAHAL